ncbi:MAG: sulfite exporter TauE/SafE family protein [Candidatus Korarchaeota archaeon]|nr:sulfite exporter TauE/SafE family protein [Candidatus Korarchaeota archaeon]
MELLYVLALLVGLAAGTLGGLIGTGGCSVMLPILHFYMDLSSPLAVGTTLFAVIFTTLSGAYGHLKIRNLDAKATAVMGGVGTLGVLLGSYLFTKITRSQIALLDLILGLVFILPSIRMLYEGLKDMRGVPAKGREPA